MATRRTTKSTAGLSDEGRFFEIKQELLAKARGPYVLTKDIVVEPITRKQSKLLRDAKGEEAQLRIILGDQYDAVEALYDDEPLSEWIAFNKDLQAHFYGRGATDLPGGSEGS